jgi:glycosyltransferase involved in cell wall biosynthesis
MLDHITPVLLTFNEADNISRTISHLGWAKDIVVVDSQSTDGTLSILRRFKQVRVFQRAFTTHGEQWRYAIEETGITTAWILRLDADYQVTEALVTEMAALDLATPVRAYKIGFDYAIFSHRLLSSLYPANTILLRRDRFSVGDKGHTEVWSVNGPVGILKARVIHDDWKSMGHWTAAQGRYMRRELDRLRREHVGLRDWLRLRPPLMPIVMLFYCLLVKGLMFSGRAGIFYTLQRVVAEAVLSLMVLEETLRKQTSEPVPGAKTTRDASHQLDTLNRNIGRNDHSRP